MTLHLSMSTNPLVNRIAEPDDLVKVCAEEIGISRLQISNEVINPAWPAAIRKRYADKIASEGAVQGVQATSVMTGAQGRQNNMTHPDPEVRAWTIDWMTKLGEIAADLGAKSVGSQYGIMTWRDYQNEAKREELLEAALTGWEEVWNSVSKLGLEFVYWEPMSVGRELGHTIEAASALNERAKARGIPLKMILDVDHGDLESGNQDDTDPYKWIEALAADSPLIHVKQSHAINKSGHNPFVEPFNSEGRIHGEELSSALNAHGPDGMEICLELSFREREPYDNRAHVIDALKRSVEYWQPFVE